MEKIDNPRVSFGMDVLLLHKHLDMINEPDPRNSRASNLIKQSALMYIRGGDDYEALLKDVSDKVFLEYKGWYKKNIIDVISSNPVHLSSDPNKGPFPKYDINKYGIAKYFDGLNKDVFEELQKIVMFLFSSDSESVLKKIDDFRDPDFVDHTQLFSFLAHSILIACIEGGDFLDRLEEIYSSHEMTENQLKECAGIIQGGAYPDYDIDINHENADIIASDFYFLSNYLGKNK